MLKQLYRNMNDDDALIEALDTDYHQNLLIQQEERESGFANEINPIDPGIDTSAMSESELFNTYWQDRGRAFGSNTQEERD